MMEAMARKVPIRTCVGTGERRPQEELLGWVLGADGEPWPDWTGKGGRLQGRSAWTLATPAAIDAAVRRRAFSRAFRAQVSHPEASVLVARAIDEGERCWRDRLGLANRAGRLGVGGVAARERARKPGRGLVFLALDAGQDVRSRFGEAVVDCRWDRYEVATGMGLAAPTGREFTSVVFVEAGRFAKDLRRISDALVALGSTLVVGSDRKSNDKPPSVPTETVDMDSDDARV